MSVVKYGCGLVIQTPFSRGTFSATGTQSVEDKLKRVILCY